MNVIAQQMSIERNARPVQEFLGLSPAQMAGLLYQPLESPELVTLNENWLPEQSMALQLFDALAIGIGKDGVKATSRGNLPIQLCRDILANTPEDLLMRPPRIRTETEFDELHTMRVVGELSGLIDIRKFKTPDSIGFEYEVQAPHLSDWLQFHA